MRRLPTHAGISPAKGWRSLTTTLLKQCRRLNSTLPRSAERPVEIKRGADQSQVSERLREISKRFAGESGFF